MIPSKFHPSYLLTILFTLWLIPWISAQQLTKEQVEQLKFRHIGPVGNRVISAVGIPGNDQVYYVGAASGGIWKTEHTETHTENETHTH